MSHSNNEEILNRIADGNTMAWMADRSREDDGDAPSYLCDCGETVPEEEWIDELKMCNFCYEEHFGGSFVSHDQAENQKSDR